MSTAVTPWSSRVITGWIMVWDLEDGKVMRFEEELDSATIVAALA